MTHLNFSSDNAARGFPRLAIAALVALVLVIAALIFVVAACNGDGDSPGANDSPTRTPGQTNGDDNGVSPTPESRSFEELLDAYLAGVDGKITYRTTSENFGEHPNLLWTHYRLGDRARFDWKNVVENPEDDPMITTIVIISTEGSYVCTTSPGIKACNARTPEEAQSAVFWLPTVNEVPEAIEAGTVDAAISSPTQREIAGVQASCFHVEVPERIGAGPAGEESFELCFSAEGALLVMSRTVTFTDSAFPTAQLDIVAQEVGEATEADFLPIATPLG
jgi:hypothetical protein